MTFDDVRKFALAWPEVEEGTSYGTPALKVRRKMLARLKEDNDSLVVPGVPPDEREMLVESQPKLFYFTDHYRDYPMVLIRLSRASRSHVEPLLRRHWRTLASKAAVREYEEDMSAGLTNGSRKWAPDDSSACTPPSWCGIGGLRFFLAF